MDDNLFLNTNTLGTLTHYNGILFGNLHAEQADTEGALAVRGNAMLGSPGHGYDVGAASVSAWKSVVIGKYENPYEYPSFLLGGEVLSESVSSTVYGGPVVLKEGYRSSYESGTFRFGTNDLRYEEDAKIDGFFDSALTSFTNTADVLSNGSTEKLPINSLRSLNMLDQSLYLSQNIDTDKKILIYNIDCADGAEISISDIALGDYINNYDAIIINAPAGIVRFQYGAILYNGSIVNTSVAQIYPGNEFIKLIADKLVFNFPNATEVTTAHYGIIGSIIAPNASVSGQGGSINGMLVADSLNQRGGMELHAFTMAMGEELLSLSEKSLTGSITVNKLDSESGDVLSGAEFILYEYDESSGTGDMVASSFTDADGILFFDALEFGSYKLKEVKPPVGYAMPQTNEWIIEITNERTTMNMQMIYIENTLARYEVNFLKLDFEEKTKKLSGAKFSLYIFNEETTEYDLLETNLTSDANGHFKAEDLLPGKYRLIETTAPHGYYLPEDAITDFEVDIYGDTDIAEEGVIKLYNKELGKVKVFKVDSEDDSVFLAVARFTLYKYTGGEYEVYRTNLETDEEGCLIIEGLEPGDYKLTETHAPAGYKLPENPNTLFSVTL